MNAENGKTKSSSAWFIYRPSAIRAQVASARPRIIRNRLTRALVCLVAAMGRMNFFSVVQTQRAVSRSLPILQPRSASKSALSHLALTAHHDGICLPRLHLQLPLPNLDTSPACTHSPNDRLVQDPATHQHTEKNRSNFDSAGSPPRNLLLCV